jgi:hypothetical protein|tara:strand:+ start:2337 stop:2798 length:462 start_codon:yes stop_codon:yes gene_type:complete
MALPGYNYKSFSEVVGLFENACSRHLAINNFEYGTLDQLDAKLQNATYPYIFLRPISSQGLQGNVRTLQFEMYSLDVPKLTGTDYLGCISDTEQYVYDIISYFRDGDYQQELWCDLVNITPVNEAFQDRVYGWVSTISYNEEGVYNYCEFPQL